ncbi:MAG: hypothetical protein WD749_14830 [Phycisphaerales bacterium]
MDLSPGQAAVDANHDGSVIAGNIPGAAARWTAGTGWTTLTSGSAAATDSTGDVVVGKTNGNPARAFLWVQGSGVSLLPLPTFASTCSARAVSADGQIVFGGYTLGGANYGFRWTAADGMQPYTSPVGWLEGCSADGAVAVGLSTESQSIGCRWTAAGAETIKAPPTMTGGRAIAVSADGRMVYGQVTVPSRPYVWDATNGFRLLQDYLAETYGLDFAGKTLLTLTAVSADSSAFVGKLAEQGTWAYLIRVPPPPPEPPSPQWQTIDGLPGVAGTVHAITQWDPDGSGPRQPLIVVGGNFTLAGSSKALRIAALDPVTRTWSNLGWGPGSSAVKALAVLPSGELVAGGGFTTVAGLPADGVAAWDGTRWRALGVGHGVGLGGVEALALLPDGSLVAAGSFATPSAPADGIARWNGTAWTPLAGGLDNNVHSIGVMPNGDLVAAGLFLNAGTVAANRVARWDGTAWHPLGSGLSARARAVTVLSSGDLIAGGSFGSAGGVNANRIARWDGTSWSPLGSGVSDDVYSLAELPDGSLAVGGVFTAAGGGTVNCVARWDGSAWGGLSSGLAGPEPAGITPRGAYALLPLAGGDLIVGGAFGTAGTAPAMSLARWNGSAWSAVSNGMNGAVLSLAGTPEGRLLAGGSFTNAGAGRANNIAQLDGASWSALGPGLGSTTPGSTRVHAVMSGSNGVVFAGGTFTAAGSTPALGIGRWDGQAWSAVGSGFNGTVSALGTYQGSLIAGGSFSSSGGATVRAIAAFDGTSWAPLGGSGANGNVNALAMLPAGALVAAGNLTALPGVSPANGIGSWNGVAWSALGQGVQGGLGIRAVAVLPGGDLVAAGSFTSAGGASVNRIARWNGTGWSPMVSSVSNSTGDPDFRALAVLPGGDLVAGGVFSAIDGKLASCIARWDGSSWRPMGAGVDAPAPQQPSVDALLVTASGELFVGGSFITAGDQVSPYLARWAFPPCYANCDASTQSPVLNVQDFGCFLARYAAGDPYANCDGSTTAPILNVQDFGCFLTRYAQGCP